MQSKKTSENNDKSSDEMKMFENKSDSKINDESFWSCNHCTFHNPIDSTTCQMCGIPDRNVCVHGSIILASSNQYQKKMKKQTKKKVQYMQPSKNNS